MYLTEDQILEKSAQRQHISILLKIVKKEVDGIRMNYPPEALIHVFSKLKK